MSPDLAFRQATSVKLGRLPPVAGLHLEALGAKDILAAFSLLAACGS